MLITLQLKKTAQENKMTTETNIFWAKGRPDESAGKRQGLHTTGGGGQEITTSSSLSSDIATQSKTS